MKLILEKDLFNNAQRICRLHIIEFGLLTIDMHRLKNSQKRISFFVSDNGKIAFIKRTTFAAVFTYGRLFFDTYRLSRAKANPLMFREPHISSTYCGTHVCARYAMRTTVFINY